MKPHLLFVVGPTACGKSDAGVEIAQAIFKNQGESQPEIINCDSVQFFAGVEIGAAKPSAELMARAKHHLIGHVPLGGSYTAGDFRRDALKIIEARAPLKTFIPVGGSGFYVQALEKGMYDIPNIPAEIREALEAETDLPKLYAELVRRDPETAKKIEPADRYRILRSLEILRFHPDGETLTAIRERFERAKPEAPFSSSKIGIFRPRDILRTRVIERTRAMLKAGLLEEVEGLRAQGLSASSPMQSVGYKEAQSYLDGQLSRENLEEAIVTSTMQLAKRQMTWFKRDPSIAWFNSEEGFSKPIAHALSLISAPQT